MSRSPSEMVVKGEAIESDSDEDIVHDFRDNTHSLVSLLVAFDRMETVKWSDQILFCSSRASPVLPKSSKESFIVAKRLNQMTV